MAIQLDKTLVQQIIKQAANKRIWLAYSGGVDSHVLLDLLAQSSEIKTLYVLHVDHGLNKDSAKWTQHCKETALALNTTFQSVKVNVQQIATLGMEAAARAARYQAFEQRLTAQDVLLTAQHQEDQAETLLLQLLRGAGPKGLSAMAASFNQGDVEIIRPLLSVSKQTILNYAQQNKLNWIDDPSNSDTQWNRNYIRHTVWPDIIQRWPSAAKTLSRSAEHCADATALMADLAEQDMNDLAISSSGNSLVISRLLTLSAARQRNLLRYYIELLAWPSPSTSQLHCIIDDLCLAQQDAMPIVAWADVELRRYQDRLYFMPRLEQHDHKLSVKLNDLNDYDLMDGKVLYWQKTPEQGVSEGAIKAGLTLRFRQGGEKIKLQGQTEHKTLKNLFQEWQIPPWQRDSIPLLFKGDDLICIVGQALSNHDCLNHNEQAYLPMIKE